LVAVLLAQLRDVGAGGNERHLPIERRDVLLGLLLDLPQLARGSVDLGLELLAPLLELCLCLRWQLREHLCRHGLAVVQRDSANTGRRYLEGERAVLGKGVQVCVQLGASRTHLGQALLSSPRVILAVERARNLPLRRLEKRRHRLRQSPALTGRYREGTWA